MKRAWIVTAAILVALVVSAGFYYHYKPDESAQIAGILGLSGIVVAVIGGLFARWESATAHRRATIAEARMQHREDFVTALFGEWDRVIGNRKLALQNNFATLASLSVPPGPGFQIAYTPNPMPILTGNAFPSNRQLWDSVRSHWPDLWTGWMIYETEWRNLEYKLRRLLENIERALPNDTPVFTWSRTSRYEPALGRLGATLEIWRHLFAWSAAGTYNVPTPTSAMARDSRGRWSVGFDEMNGFGGGSEAEAKAAARAINGALTDPVNIAYLREVRAARDKTIRALDEAASLLQRAQYDRRLVGVCNLCPDGPADQAALTEAKLVCALLTCSLRDHFLLAFATFSR